MAKISLTKVYVYLTKLFTFANISHLLIVNKIISSFIEKEKISVCIIKRKSITEKKKKKNCS